jgi:hypothetical protein
MRTCKTTGQKVQVHRCKFGHGLQLVSNTHSCLSYKDTDLPTEWWVCTHGSGMYGSNFVSFTGTVRGWL